MRPAAPAAALAAAALTLSACAGKPAPELEKAAPPLPPAFRFAPDAATGVRVADLLPRSDPAFVALATASLAGSPDLAEAAARIDRARAAADRAGAERLPAIGAGASVAGERTNPGAIGADLPPGIAFDTTRVIYGANLTASWDADLFGVLRARERAAAAQVRAAEASSAAVQLALVAEIAAAVIDWRTLAAREVALTADLTAAEDLARLSATRERAGIAPGFDRVRAEGAAASSRSRLAALASERARIVGRLATLTAQDAAAVEAALAAGAGRDLPAGAVPVALPSTLLTGRPDVLAADANLAAADAQLAATARSRFPRLDLSAALGLLAFGIGDLFDTDSIVGSLAASIAAPLFDFGRIAAEIDAAAADERIAFAQYRGAVFRALGEAETAYGLVAAADAEAAAAGREAESLDRAARLAATRQRAGLSDFLTVLEARRAADASGERAAAAQGRALRARVLLWQALGGSPGEPLSPPPPPAGT